MAFTVGATLAKDSGGTAIPGGLLSADVAGGGVGPTFMFHGVVDGIAGSTKLGVYAEDAAAASDPTGTMMLAVRRDTLSASEVSADGDNVAAKATSKGQLHVYAQVDATQLAILNTATFTYANAGSSAGVQGVALPSDQVWGVGAAGFTKLEDAASADGDKGVAILAVRKATPANTSGTDGDYEFPQISAGSMWVASVATDKTLVSERVIAGGSQWETVAASVTDQSLGATGATGDYLECLVCVVATAATSQVQIKDGAGSAITVLPNAVGAGVGTYTVPIGLISLAGAWKVTTAAGVSVIGTGRFT